MKIPKPRRRYISFVATGSRPGDGTRRVRIDPTITRELFIYETRKTKEAIQKIIDDPETSDRIRIQAANCFANLTRVAYQMVRDIDIEDVERQLEELENECNKNEDIDFASVETDPMDVEGNKWKNDPRNSLPQGV